jgi:hypothetical protein
MAASKRSGHVNPVVVIAVLFVCVIASARASAGPIPIGEWLEFGFTEPGVGATGCSPDDPAGNFCIPSFGTPTSFLDAPAWTFTAPATGATLLVTDAFLSGDQFEILDFGIPIAFTSPPAAAGAVDCGDDPVPCFATAGISTLLQALAAGDHSLTIAALQAPSGGGSGYLRIDAVTAPVPEPGTLLLMATGFGIAAIRRRSRR